MTRVNSKLSNNNNDNNNNNRANISEHYSQQNQRTN